MDPARFAAACEAALTGDRARQGIGTLGERSLHAALKEYFRGDGDETEVPVGRFVADIRGPGGITEVQTRDFNRLRGKLEHFLPLGPVTVVYPIPALKWLVWLGEDGSATPRRKSPKQAQACEVLPELSKIKPWLGHENLRLCLVFLEVEEYRLQNGWGNNGKRGSTRYERLPLALLGELWVQSLSDYQQLLPAGLPEEFTAKEFAKAGKLAPKKASFALGTLREAGTIRQVGKRGRAFLYGRNTERG